MQYVIYLLRILTHIWLIVINDQKVERRTKVPNKESCTKREKRESKNYLIELFFGIFQYDIKNSQKSKF